MNERFDFTGNNKAYNLLSCKLDHLNVKEMLYVQKAVQEAGEVCMKEKISLTRVWVENGILPLIKDYAEDMCALLEIKESTENVFEVTLQSEHGFEMDSSHKWVRFLLAGASRLTMELDKNKIVLFMAFDCNTNSGLLLAE